MKNIKVLFTRECNSRLTPPLNGSEASTTAALVRWRIAHSQEMLSQVTTPSIAKMAFLNK